MSRSHYAGIKSSNFLGHRGNFQTGMLVPYLLVTQLTTMMQEHFLKSSHSVCARGIIFLYVTIRSFLLWQLIASLICHMDNSLGTLSHLWSFFQYTHAQLLSPSQKQRWTCVSTFFPNFNIVKGRRRDNCNKISEACNVLWGKLEIKQNYEHWSTFPTIFLSRVVWTLGFRTTMFSPFIPRLLSILDTIRQPRAIVLFSK